MSTVEVRFLMPKEITEDIKDISTYGYQSFILGLYIDEEISLGKAAKLLNMTHDEFIVFLGHRGVPYFRNSPDEIRDALRTLREL